MTPSKTGNNEDAGEEVNSPICQVKEQHLPPPSSTSADPATTAGTSTTPAPSATPQTLPIPVATSDAASVPETYEEMSVRPSEAASTMRRRIFKRYWTNPILTTVQRGSLKAMRERADAMNPGVKDMTDIFVADMEVRFDHAL